MKNLSKNGTLVPFLGAMTQNSVFAESKTLPFPHSHFVTLPLVYYKTSSKKGGSMTACGYCGGIAPRGYLRGSPLDTPFVSFLVKGKIPRCGARSSTKGRFAET